MTLRHTPILLLGLCGNVVGCGGDGRTLAPAGQLLVFVDTDAPLPAAPGVGPGCATSPPLFDHLRVDVSRGANADEASEIRDFPLHCGLFAQGPVSFGVAPPVGEAVLTARLRLYRGADARDAEPSPSSTIDRLLVLPSVDANAIERAFVMMSVDDTGLPGTVTEPNRVVPTESHVGSWPGAARVGCEGEPRRGEVCVPGGAFWMGDPELSDETEVQNAQHPHLVVVSPFFLDAQEVTVAELRESREKLGGAPLPPSWSGGSEGLDEDDYSTFTLGPSDADPVDAHGALPVNAVTWETARAHCLLQDKDLPSEVMFEFAASGAGLERKYVWGDDEPDCDDAVSGRAGFGVYATFDGSCRPAGSIGGVAPAGFGQRDRLGLMKPLISDLAGNLSEWALDWFTAEGEGPWANDGVSKDPLADVPGGIGLRRTVRGGSWRGAYVELRAAARTSRDPGVANRSIGFRCARRP